ncbi:Outer membrane protein transport protein (OMPP1/FadL/TodX) [Ruegeria denitrificans]|uniref:Outer membrane protein transport protein (OMPP1/FadL/TodX) n=1 Tax=Ruegeria denitrificans TaxID=1715692 RepID=A0A0P1I6R1_9RHOB|nr:outer membrane protein transport protein [Ruegeria denitrificans]CUJ93480.1 Outer membrane protein transport protein (OMPP1/FadL/TodX) [Ruegeria denitrificans]
MKKALLQACAVCVGTTGAYAGGIDRSGQGINLIFEEGTVVQFGLSYTDPDVSGTMPNIFGAGEPVDSGNIANDFFTPHLGFKTALTDQLDLAIIYDEPFGADIAYSSAYPLSINPFNPTQANSLRAQADIDAITALLRYKFDNGFSALGGVRVQRVSEARIGVPIVGDYSFDAGSEVDFGYVIGVAWEKPEIAARVALTYNSKITHNLSQTEVIGGASFETSTEVDTPQSVNLDFQTGVAPKTLLFGSIRWVDWPQLDVAPPVYTAAVGSSLVDYDNATYTYSLGLGYQFTDEFAGAVTLGYETDEGIPVSNLSPTDGFWSVGLGGTYSLEKAKISAGVRYTDIGDATADGAFGQTADFTGNSAWSVGFQITYSLG